MSRKNRIILVVLLFYVGSYLGFRVASNFREPYYGDCDVLVVPHNQTLHVVNTVLCYFFLPAIWFEETIYGEERIFINSCSPFFTVAEIIKDPSKNAIASNFTSHVAGKRQKTTHS